MAAEAAYWAGVFGGPEAAAQKWEIVEVLLNHGAELDIWTAASAGRGEQVARLLAARGYPALANAYDNGSTPLHCAAGTGRAEVAGLLLENGAALEARDFSGGTPLRRAVGFIPGLGRGYKEAAAALGKWDQIETMLGDKPDLVNTRGGYGFTPLNWAVLNGQATTAALLLARGADANILTWDKTPLRWALDMGHAEVADLLRQHGGVV